MFSPWQYTIIICYYRVKSDYNQSGHRHDKIQQIKSNVVHSFCHFKLVVESLKEAGSGALRSVTTLTEIEEAKRLIQSHTSCQGSFFSLDDLLDSCQDALYQVKCEEGWLQNLQKWHANTVSCVLCIGASIWTDAQNNIPESAFLVSCWAASHCQQLMCRLMLESLSNATKKGWQPDYREFKWHKLRFTA